MKKKIFAILLVLALCVSVLTVIAACNTDDNTNNNAPGDIPTEEGKVTFYCTIEDYEVPSYATPVLQGPYNPEGKWQPGVFMTNIEGTNTWYVIVDIAPETLLANIQEDEGKPDDQKGKWNNYMICMGYNASSGMPTDKLGDPSAAYKSDETAAPGGMNNPTYEYSGGNTVNLGAQHFTQKIIPAPDFFDTKLAVKTVALGEYADVQIRGSFNNWGNEGETIKATPNADRTEWTIDVKAILVGGENIFKVLICEDTREIKDDKNKDNSWTAQNKEGKNAYIQVVYGKDPSDNNCTFSATRSDKTAGIVYIVGETTVLDPSKAVDRVIDLKATTEVTFTVEFSEKVADGLKVWIGGSAPFFGAWTAESFPEMTTTDRKTWTLTVEIDDKLFGNEYEFKVIVGDNEDDLWKNTNFGDDKGENAKLTLRADETTIKLFEKPLVMPKATEE